tara:strand:- start:485 stop:790 length:306 start_codon:yes stop_codon:yes gene_type:complete
LTLKTASSHPVKPHKHLSVYSLGATPINGVEIDKDLRPPMFYRNRFAQLTTEAAENAAQLVITQLSERLNFSKHQSKIDKEMECLQFGICSYQPQNQKVVL